jgi:hypothetical protein
MLSGTEADILNSVARLRQASKDQKRHFSQKRCQRLIESYLKRLLVK